MSGQSTRRQAEAMQFDSVRGRHAQQARIALRNLKEMIAVTEQQVNTADAPGGKLSSFAGNGIASAAATLEAHLTAWGAVEEVSFLRPGGER
jgi:lysophospholipid acyltransferase (LPLAT)-like uncharacterized protein